MDFGMYAPPERPKNNLWILQGATIRVADELPTTVATGTIFHYSGPTSSYPYSVFFWCLISISAIWVSQRWDLHFKLELAGVAVLVIGVILLLVHWIVVSADAFTLSIHKWFSGEFKVPISEIQKITTFTSTRRHTFVGISLKSGKAFDLFLPRKKRLEFVAFILGRIRFGNNEKSIPPLGRPPVGGPA